MWSAMDSGFSTPWLTHPVRLFVLRRSSVWKKPSTPFWQSAGSEGAEPAELSDVAVMVAARVVRASVELRGGYKRR